LELICLGPYFRKKFGPQYYEKYPIDSDEDAVFFDAESHCQYHHVHPGTITVQGYAIEAWEQEAFLNPRFNRYDIMTSPDNIPSFKFRAILRRLHDMQTREKQLGYNQEREFEELAEFAGAKG
jgi:hypothetical protein